MSQADTIFSTATPLSDQEYMSRRAIMCGAAAISVAPVTMLPLQAQAASSPNLKALGDQIGTLFIESRRLNKICNDLSDTAAHRKEAWRITNEKTKDWPHRLEWTPAQYEDWQAIFGMAHTLAFDSDPARRRANNEADFANHKEDECLEAILYAPANTLDDLGVKAQAAAATNHELWDEPANDLDWDQHFVRELIEAVARLANKSIAFVEKPAA